MPELPFTSSNPLTLVDLWQWMDGQRAMGNELLAISHNGTLSNGLMFPDRARRGWAALDKAWAETRMRNEPCRR